MTLVNIAELASSATRGIFPVSSTLNENHVVQELVIPVSSVKGSNKTLTDSTQIMPVHVEKSIDLSVPINAPKGPSANDLPPRRVQHPPPPNLAKLTEHLPSRPEPSRAESSRRESLTYQVPARRGVEVSVGRGSSYRPSNDSVADRSRNERDRWDDRSTRRDDDRNYRPDRSGSRSPARRDQSPVRRDRSPGPRGRSPPRRDRSLVRGGASPVRGGKSPARIERSPPPARAKSPVGRERTPPRRDLKDVAKKQDRPSSRWDVFEPPSREIEHRRDGSREGQELAGKKRDVLKQPTDHLKLTDRLSTPKPTKPGIQVNLPAVAPPAKSTAPSTSEVPPKTRNFAVEKLTSSLSLGAKLEARLAIEGTVKLSFKGNQPSLPSVINALNLPNLLRLEYRNAALYLRLLDAATASHIASSYKNNVKSEEARKTLERVKLSHPADYFPPIKNDTMGMYSQGTRRRMLTRDFQRGLVKEKEEFLEAAKKQWGYFNLEIMSDGRIIIEFDGIETAFLAKRSLNVAFKNVELLFIEERGAEKQ